MNKHPLSFTEVLPNGVSFEMIFVEGGEFDMGAKEKEADKEDKPVHRIKLDSFFIGKLLVVQVLWENIMGDNPSSFKGDNLPVENVSWDDTIDFLEKLNMLTDKQYRLPSEAEWEYAARGGIYCEDYIFSGSDKLKEVGWFIDSNVSETSPVGQKYGNELGLYDMSGNVWEWCNDWYSGKYYKQCLKKRIVNNPKGPLVGKERIFRGGSWYSEINYCKTSYRNKRRPSHKGNNIGFRLALSSES